MASVRDESLTRCWMALCLGAALLIPLSQWQFASFQSRTKAARSQTTATSSQSVKNTASEALPTPVNSPTLVVDLSQRHLYIYRAEKLIAKYPVSVGQKGWETPAGSFKVTQMQKNPVWRHPITGDVIPSGPNNPLGSRWIGFWSDGRTEIGFHGTNQEELVGQPVSHGCLRMRDRDIRKLYSLVSMGTPVTVRP